MRYIETNDLCQQIAKSTLTGALWGGLSGAASNLSYDEDWLSSIFKHSFFEGGLEGLQGGNVFHGMLVGAVSSSGSRSIYRNATSLSNTEKCIMSSLLGGVVSEIGGGNFANGAITGAFSFLFNDRMHVYTKRRKLAFKYIARVPFNYGPTCSTFMTFYTEANIIETYFPNSSIDIDAFAITLTHDYFEVSAGLEMKVTADSYEQKKVFIREYKGDIVVPVGSQFLGEVHFKNIQLNRYKTVKVKLTSSWSCQDYGMGRFSPLGILKSKSYNIK